MIHELRSRRYTLLWLLLAADFAFIALYALYGFKFVTDPKFGLIEDWSYGEVFQYTKELWLVLLLAALFLQYRAGALLSWCMLCVYLLLDDSLRIHESGGEFVADTLGFAPWLGLRAVDFGELVVSAAAGLLLLSVIVSTYRCRQIRVRRFSQRLGLLFLGLLFFGIGVDMIPRPEAWLADKALGAIEDGGEQICMSMMLAYVFINSMYGLREANEHGHDDHDADRPRAQEVSAGRDVQELAAV